MSGEAYGLSQVKLMDDLSQVKWMDGLPRVKCMVCFR